MTSQKSKSLPWLGGLLLLVIAATAWIALRASEVSPTTTPTPTEVTAGEPIAADADAVKTLELETPRPALAEDKGASAAADSAEARTLAATQADLELADAIWFDGRIEWPEQTPIGEEVDVIANGRAFASRPMYRTRVQPDGSFRVAVAKKTRAATIEIDARHVYLPEPERVRLKDGKLTEGLLLKPKLGGCITGLLRLPPGAEDLVGELAGTQIGVRSTTPSGDSSTSWERAEIGKDLRFELRGLDAARVHAPQLYAECVTPLEELPVTVSPGETKAIEIDLRLGVRLRGQIHFEGDAAFDDVLLKCESLVESAATPLGGLLSPNYDADFAEDGRASFTRYVELDEQGRFDFRGVVPGEIVLEASAPQRLSAKLELGTFADGEVRDGIELRLALGGQIGGFVRWPDGTAAAGAGIAWVSASGESEENPFAYGFMADTFSDVRTDASGAFWISGLGDGHYHVRADAASREPVVKGMPKPAAWSVRVESVAVGTRDLVMVLNGGSTIHGRVVDDTGAPIERFSLRATPQLEGDFAEHRAVTLKVHDKTGRFELAGLTAGTHRVALSVAKHDAGEDLIVETPAQTGPFTLVAQRRATISGTVHKPDGTPAPGASLNVFSQNGMGGVGFAGRVSKSGEFKTRPLPAGRTALHATLDGFGASTPFIVELGPGNEVTGVVLVLRRPGRILGEVHAAYPGESIANREVMAYGTTLGTSLEALTDDRGRFEFSNVDPDTYRVELPPSPEALAARGVSDDEEDDWELAQAMSRNATVALEDGGEAHVVFGSPQQAQIPLAGRVVDASGPIAGAYIHAIPTDATDDRSAVFARSDDSGAFALLLPHAGNYRVRAHASDEDSLSTSSTVEVPLGGVADFQITLGTGRIAGRVRVRSVESGGWISVTLARGENDAVASSGSSDEWPEGVFQFNRLPAGRYTLHVTAVLGISGPGRTRTLHQTQTIDLADGQQALDLLIEL